MRGKMKKRILFLTILIFIFLLNSTLTFAPSSQSTGIQDEHGQDENQLKRISKVERWQKEKEEYFKRMERGLLNRADSSNVELVGLWPYGACRAVALDSSRNIALIGNGEAFQVLDISDPSVPSLLGETVIQADLRDIAIAGDYAYALTDRTFSVVDISTLSAPDVHGVVEFDGHAQSVEVSSNYAYVAASWGGLGEITQLSLMNILAQIGVIDWESLIYQIPHLQPYQELMTPKKIIILQLSMLQIPAMLTFHKKVIHITTAAY